MIQTLSIAKVARRLNRHPMKIYHAALRVGVPLRRRGGKCVVPRNSVRLLDEAMRPKAVAAYYQQ